MEYKNNNKNNYEDVYSALPEFLPQMLKEQYGEENAEKIINGYTLRRKVTLRVNTLRSTSYEIKKSLENAGINSRGVEWSSDAFILENATEKEIMGLDIFKDGKIYMQSLSSMLPPIILKPRQGADILDMAAAPGGKTTQMAAISENKAHITACEMNSIRAERLKYNIDKQGASCVYVMQKDSRTLDDFFSFDQILLDAPCSGSGVLSVFDVNLKKTFTRKLISKSTAAQTALIKKAIKLLKRGQEMVYSTCSVLTCENEEIVRSVVSGKSAEIVPIELDGMENIPVLPVKIPGTLCVAPNELYEGFFIAKIRKK